MAVDIERFRMSVSDEIRRAFDQYAHAITTIDEEHRMVHDGFGFSVSHTHTGLANAATGYTLHKVGSKPAHIRACDIVVSDSPATITLYEGPTVSADGTLVATVNLNRLSSNTAEMATYHGPTVTDPGTQLSTRFVPDMGGTGSNDIGATQTQFGEEWILAPNTDYLLAITNTSGGAITWSCNKFFYELDYKS